MENYFIHKTFGKEKIKKGDLLRVDLLDGFKIKDIDELKNFNIFYETKGHEDFYMKKGERIKRKVRYIRVFEKKKK